MMNIDENNDKGKVTNPESIDRNKIQINNKRIWLTWEIQRRNISLSERLNAEYFPIISNKNRLIKYPVNIIKTLFLYLNKRPGLIFVQNPSIVLSLLTIIFGKIYSIPVIMDAHNAGVYPLEGKFKLLNCLAIYLFRNASLVIVSNKYLAKYVKKNRGNAFDLPDPLPHFYGCNIVKNNGIGQVILFICTWAADEPYLEVIKAAEHIDKSIKVFITGNSKGKEKQATTDLSENIVLTGFLPDEKYISLLASCDIVIDLTTRDNCLVCGAYEGIEFGKPLILSNKKALKEYFYKGVVFTENNETEIASSITYAIKNLEYLIREINELKVEIKDRWEMKLEKLEKEIEKLY